MKTDKYMQGILVNDPREFFNHQKRQDTHKLTVLMRRLKTITNNFKDLKYYTKNSQKFSSNNAVFSKNNIDQPMDIVLADVIGRLRTKR